MNVWNLIETLYKDQTLEKEELVFLLEHRDEETASCLGELARKEAQKIYGNKVFPRGLIEFTNYCKNNCYYCGIQASNRNISRYRLSQEQILSACQNGYDLGYRSFVLQGGEDPYFSDERMVPVVEAIHESFPDCAITLSLGERSWKAIRSFTPQEAADIFCATKPFHQSFMENFTLKKCLSGIESNVSMTCVRPVFR